MLHINGIWISVGWKKLAFSQTCIPVICDQVRKKKHQKSVPFQFIFKNELVGPYHCINILRRIFHAVDPSDRIFPAEAAYMDHFLCSHSLKSHPAVRPGIIHVCLIPGLHTGWDQKCFSTCQMILMAIHLKNSASGFHDMKYMRDPFIWSKSMSRIAFFPPTISKTEIHRTFL